MTRYWVGGTGLWNDTSHWSTTSGGGGGSTTPTSADNVYFDASSFSANGQTVTVNTTANCLDMNWSGIIKTVTFTSTTNILNVYGNLTLYSGLTWNFTVISSTAQLTLKATDSRNIITNGVIMTSKIYFDGVGGSWTHLDNCTINGNFFSINGTWNMNGFNITLNQISGNPNTGIVLITTSAGTRTINMGSSTIDLYAWSNTFGVVVTVNCGTSTLIVRNYIIGNFKVFYNIIRYVSSLTGSDFNWTTCNNLTLIGGDGYYGNSNGVTINGILTISGTSPSSRLIYKTNTTGTRYTTTVNPANVVASNVDFQDIEFSQSTDLSSISGGSGNLGNNNNIIFTTGTNLYYVTTGSSNNWLDTTKWMTTSGGSTQIGRNPLPQDSVVFDSGSFTTGNTLTLNTSPRITNMNWSGMTKTVSFVSSVNSLYIYGDLTLYTGLTWSFTGTAYLNHNGSSNITFNGVTANMNCVYFNTIGGTFMNQDDVNYGSTTLYLVNGTWSTNGKTITTTGNIDTAEGTKTLNLGASILNCSTFTSNDATNTPNLVVTGTTSTINCTTAYYSSPYATHTTYNVNVTGNYVYLGATNNIFNNFTFAPTTSKTAELLLRNGKIFTVTNMLTFSGNTESGRLFIHSETTLTQRTITAANITASNVNFRDIIGAGTANWNLSSITGGSGNRGGNSGITFTPSVTQYYKHTSGACNWSDGTKWFTATNGGGSIGRIPLPQDDAIFDVNSFSGTSDITLNNTQLGRDFNLTNIGVALTITIINNTTTFGSFLGSNNMSITTIGLYSFLLDGFGTHTINTFNKVFYRFGPQYSGNYTVMSDMTFTYALVVSNGTFDFNDFNLNTNYCAISNSITYLGNGTITLTSNNIFSWQFLNGTLYCEGSTIKLNSTFPISNIQFVTNGGQTYNKLWLFGIPSTFSYVLGNTVATPYSDKFNEIVIEPGVKLGVIAGSTQTIGKLTAVGTAGSRITITSTTAVQHTLTQLTGSTQTHDVDYCDISYSKTNVGTWNAGDNSQDLGNNTGWEFGYIPVIMWY